MDPGPPLAIIHDDLTVITVRTAGPLPPTASIPLIREDTLELHLMPACRYRWPPSVQGFGIPWTCHPGPTSGTNDSDPENIRAAERRPSAPEAEPMAWHPGRRPVSAPPAEAEGEPALMPGLMLIRWEKAGSDGAWR